jgi:hypothetical protein
LNSSMTIIFWSLPARQLDLPAGRGNWSLGNLFFSIIVV